MELSLRGFDLILVRFVTLCIRSTSFHLQTCLEAQDQRRVWDLLRSQQVDARLCIIMHAPRCRVLFKWSPRQDPCARVANCACSVCPAQFLSPVELGSSKPRGMEPTCKQISASSMTAFQAFKLCSRIRVGTHALDLCGCNILGQGSMRWDSDSGN